MIQLNGVELNGSMIWTDRYAWSPVAQTTKVTLGGAQVVYSAKLLAGRPITLVATDESGWLTMEQADLVQGMADQPGGVYTLTIDAETYSVMFRHDDPPALQLNPLIGRAKPETGDYFTGTIKLMTL